MVATFPGAGSPPALWGPSGRWLEHPISTTFRWYDATRHRRPRRRIRRRLWTRPCGKVAVRQGVPHHIDGDQDHKISWPQPLEHPHRVLFLTRSPPAQAPSSSASTAHSFPHRTHTIRRTTSLDSSTQHQNKPSSWTHLPGADQTAGEAPPNMAQRRPPDHCPVPPLALPHEQNNSTRPPPTPAQSGDTLFPTTRSRSVHAVHDRVPAGASHGHPFSRRTSTVLSTNKYRSRERGAGAGGRDSPRAHATAGPGTRPGKPGPKMKHGPTPPRAWAR